MNKASPYVIEFVAWVVTVLSFLYWCVVVAEFFYYLYSDPAPIVYTLCNVIILVSTHMPAAINCATGSTMDTIPYNASIMANNFRKLHMFKTMYIRDTKNNLVGVDIGPFIYIRIRWNMFVLLYYGKVCATQWKQKMIQK